MRPRSAAARRGRSCGATVIERTYWCDRDGCERNSSTAESRPPLDFISVSYGGQRLHFCSWDCLMHYSAAQPAEHAVEDE